MIKPKWFTHLFLFLFILLLVLNLYVFFTREWESSFCPTTYATLYYSLDIPTIREWELLGRDRLRLDLACTKNIVEWKILTDGGKEQTALGMKPSFVIDTTFRQPHAYRLVPVPEGACQTIEISIQFYPREFYKSLGLDRSDVYIVRANVPCGKFEQFSVGEWVDDYHYVGGEGLAKADRILREEVGIREGEPTYIRMEKLFRYLRIKLKGIGGVPRNDERWMNPWLLYNELVNGTGKGWCTQYAQEWVFWANRAGIPTRFVFGARTQDNTIVYTGHSWAESFIGEQNRWAFVDLSQGHVYIRDKEGQVLNTVELLQLNQHNAFDSTFARLYVDWEWEKHPGISGTDTVVTVPFAICNSLIRSEFTAHSILKYRRPPNVEDVREIYTGFTKDKAFLWGNLVRYLFKPQLAYSFYPTEGGQTYSTRRFLFFTLLGIFVIWVALVIRGRRG